MKRFLAAISLLAIVFLSSCAPARVGVGVNVGPRGYYGRPYYARPYYGYRPYYSRPYYSRPHYYHYRGYRR